MALQKILASMHQKIAVCPQTCVFLSSYSCCIEHLMRSVFQKKEMPSNTVSFFFTLMLLLHCTSAASNLSRRQTAKTWCVAKPSADEVALRANLEFACSESDCGAIQGTGGCSSHDGGLLLSRASVAMNDYYQARGRNSWNCFFNGTGLITITDPSLGSCNYA